MLKVVVFTDLRKDARSWGTPRLIWTYEHMSMGNDIYGPKTDASQEMNDSNELSTPFLIELPYLSTE